MWILGLIIGGLLFFALIIWLLSFYWRRVIDKNITAHFRAAESITEHGEWPKEWVIEVEQKLSGKIATWFGIRRPSGINLLLDKIDVTTRFFEDGRFYADDTAKQLLLAQLADARAQLEKMSWEEVLLARGQIRNLDRKV